jgi:hypothetical protein
MWEKLQDCTIFSPKFFSNHLWMGAKTIVTPHNFGKPMEIKLVTSRLLEILAKHTFIHSTF